MKNRLLNGDIIPDFRAGVKRLLCVGIVGEVAEPRRGGLPRISLRIHKRVPCLTNRTKSDIMSLISIPHELGVGACTEKYARNKLLTMRKISKVFY